MGPMHDTSAIRASRSWRDGVLTDDHVTREELAAAASDAVILQGQRDPFGTPDELRAAVAAVAQAGSRAIHAVPGTHSLQPRSAAVRSAVVAALLAPVAGFVADRVPV